MIGMERPGCQTVGTDTDTQANCELNKDHFCYKDQVVVFVKELVTLPSS